MKIFSYLLILGSVLSLTLCEIQKIGSVYELTDNDYQKFMEENAIVMLKLYSPNCGHCQQLAPEYAKAAEMMESQGVIFAQMDATQEVETAEKLEIEGYPTVFLFVNGSKKEYNDERQAEAIVEWVQRRILPSILRISTVEELDQLYDKNSTEIVILYLGPFEGEIYGIFSVLANQIEQSGLFFVESNDEQLVSKYSLKNRIVILKKFDEERVELEAEANETTVEQFVKWNRVPSVMGLGTKYSDIIFNEQVGCLFLFLAANDTERNKALIHELNNSAKVLNKQIFITIGMDDEEISQKMMEFLIIPSTSLPKVFIVDPKEDNVLKYLYTREVINSEGLIEFFEQYKKGELAPFYQSQGIPEQDYIDSIRQLVGRNFKQVLQSHKENSQYVLVKFFASWCPHSQKLKDKFIKLAQLLKESNDRIVLAEIDSTLNEIEELPIEGVPTLILFKPSEEQTRVEYSGKMNLRGIAKFLEEQMKEDWVQIQIELENEEEEEDEEEDEELEEDDDEEIEYDDDDDEIVEDDDEEVEDEKTDL